MRYSVGAWQSTVTPSRSHSARRSTGSNRASQMSAAAPVSQGATKTFRADFDQPVAVVTQTRSSLPEPTQFSACPRCAGRYEAVWSAARGSPVVPEVKTIRAGSPGARSAMDAGVSCGRSSSRTASISAIVMHSTPPGMEPRSSSSPTQSEGFATATRCSRSPGRSWVDIGRATAPIRHAASIVSTHSIRLPASVMTTSPRLTPRAARAPDTPALIAISSPKCHTRLSPLASMASSAGLADGNCSRTSEMKFIAA